MTKTLIALAAAAAFSSAAFADCTYPHTPGKAPDGSKASRDEMLAAKKLVDQYNVDINKYLECIKSEYDAALAKDAATLTEEQKQQMAARYTQKNDAAVDEVTGVVNSFNEQLRAYKAAGTAAKK